MIFMEVFDIACIGLQTQERKEVVIKNKLYFRFT